MGDEDVRAGDGWRPATRWLFLAASVAVTGIVVPMLLGLAVSVATPVAAVLLVTGSRAGWCCSARCRGGSR